MIDAKILMGHNSMGVKKRSHPKKICPTPKKKSPKYVNDLVTWCVFNFPLSDIDVATALDPWSIHTHIGIDSGISWD